jgi:hypothetical protein
MTEPMNVASQADMRNPASRVSRAITGVRATIQVVTRLPVGSRIWVNMRVPRTGAVLEHRRDVSPRKSVGHLNSERPCMVALAPRRRDHLHVYAVALSSFQILARMPASLSSPVLDHEVAEIMLEENECTPIRRHIPKMCPRRVTEFCLNGARQS